MGFGCWAIGGPFWSGRMPIGWGVVDDTESIRAIHRALELGVTFFDTADVYGAGHSERILGQALAGRREQVCIATKFGNKFDETSRRMAGSDASPKYIRQACLASLRRLGVEYIDLYQLHLGLPIAKVGPVVETLEALVAEGLIRGYGWSTDDPEGARVFARGPNCIAVQHRLNVIEDHAPMLAVCTELNLASINRSPLAMGLLTGKFQSDSTIAKDDIRSANPAWMVYFKNGKPSDEWLRRVASVREVLTSGGRTLAQGALAWIWARSEQTIAIPGCRTVAQVEENAGAMRLGPLRQNHLREIDSLLGREVE